MKVEQLLELLKDGPLGFSEIAFNFMSTEDKEIKKIINDCVSKNIIKKIGEKRGTKYSLLEGKVNDEDEVYDTSNALIEMTRAQTDFDFKLLKNVDKFLKSKDPVYMYFANVNRGSILDIYDDTNIFDFLKDGSINQEYTVNFDNVTAKNKLIKDEIKYAMNAMTVGKDFESSEYKLVFYNFSKNRYKDFNGTKRFKNFNELKKFLDKLFYE